MDTMSHYAIDATIVRKIIARNYIAQLSFTLPQSANDALLRDVRNNLAQ